MTRTLAGVLRVMLIVLVGVWPTSALAQVQPWDRTPSILVTPVRLVGTGGLVFPDGTIQTTAALGGGSGFVLFQPTTAQTMATTATPAIHFDQVGGTGGFLRFQQGGVDRLDFTATGKATWTVNPVLVTITNQLLTAAEGLTLRNLSSAIPPRLPPLAPWLGGPLALIQYDAKSTAALCPLAPGDLGACTEVAEYTILRGSSGHRKSFAIAKLIEVQNFSIFSRPIDDTTGDGAPIYAAQTILSTGTKAAAVALVISGFRDNGENQPGPWFDTIWTEGALRHGVTVRGSLPDPTWHLIPNRPEVGVLVYAAARFAFATGAGADALNEGGGLALPNGPDYASRFHTASFANFATADYAFYSGPCPANAQGSPVTRWSAACASGRPTLFGATFKDESIAGIGIDLTDAQYGTEVAIALPLNKAVSWGTGQNNGITYDGSNLALVNPWTGGQILFFRSGVGTIAYVNVFGQFCRVATGVCVP